MMVQTIGGHVDYMLPDKVYQVAKWFGLILCPALATLIGAVGPAWGMPNVDSIVLTLNATGVFVGTVIGVSQLKASANGQG